LRPKDLDLDLQPMDLDLTISESEDLDLDLDLDLEEEDSDLNLDLPPWDLTTSLALGPQFIESHNTLIHIRMQCVAHFGVLQQIVQGL